MSHYDAPQLIILGLIFLSFLAFGLTLLIVSVWAGFSPAQRTPPVKREVIPASREPRLQAGPTAQPTASPRVN